MSDRAVVTTGQSQAADAAGAEAAHSPAPANGGAGNAIGGPAPGEWTQAELIEEIRESFTLVQPHGAQAAAWFYEHFFAANPRYRKYFSADPAGRHRRVFQAVERIVSDLDRLDEFLPYLRRLALRHRKFGLRAAHYQAFGASLSATVAHYCGPRWNERTAAAWEAAYGLVANVMLDTVTEANAGRAPYWEAEVVAHEELAPGIARIALRPIEDPDRPGAYSFRAGQYAAVESSSLIRVWRDYSFAKAPDGGPDVEFHIQAGRAGGLSDSLVAHAGVGDRMRIAEAEGELAFPPARRADRLLAVAHGTGAAPVAALVEAALAQGDRRPTTVLLVSDQGPHYLAGRFAELAARHGSLDVEEVVGDPSAAAVRVHSAAAQPSGNRGAVLVGPSAMVDQCRAALLAAGVEPDDVSCDLFD